MVVLGWDVDWVVLDVVETLVLEATVVAMLEELLKMTDDVVAMFDDVLRAVELLRDEVPEVRVLLIVELIVVVVELPYNTDTVLVVLDVLFWAAVILETERLEVVVVLIEELLAGTDVALLVITLVTLIVSEGALLIDDVVVVAESVT